MLNLINELQAGILLSFVFAVHYVYAVIHSCDLFDYRSFVATIRTSMKIFFVAFHISLIWLEIDILLYLWFWYAMLHFWIHAKYAKYTIVETNKITWDEAWHFLNQSAVVYYMLTHDVDIFHLKVYVSFVAIYLCLLFLFISGVKRAINPIYYLGSFMELYFIYSLSPSSLPVFVASAFLHMGATWLITFENRAGRMLVNCDVAGCAFLAEFLTLYLIHNGIY